MSDDEAVADEPPTEPSSVATRLLRKRWLGWTMIGVGGLLLLAGIYLVLTGLLVKHELEDVRSDVATMRSQLANDDIPAARRTLADLRTRADRAETWSSGPVWALAADLPGGGEPIETVRGIADAVQGLADTTLPALLDARDQLHPATLRAPDGSIRLAQIVAVQPELKQADDGIRRALKGVGSTPARTWLGTVDNARSQLLDELAGIAGSVRAADLAAQLVPPMLGDDGVKRYFVAFQNEAETRGTGGLPGTWGVAEASHGKVRFVRFGSDSFFNGVKVDVDNGTDFADLYGGYLPDSLFVNGNASPNFPYAARIWAAMWQAKTGERLDGVLALDPTALSYLLGPAGPVTLSDGTRIDAGNVVDYVSSTEYQRYPDVNVRKAQLVELAKTVGAHVLSGAGAPSALADAAEKALHERRIMIWSADPAQEQLISQTPGSGELPETTRPFGMVWLENEAGDKLDYYVSGTVRWQRSGCGAQRAVEVTVSLTNSAPSSGLTEYVVHRLDDRPKPIPYGDTRDYVYLAGTTGGYVQSVTIDGKPVSAGAGFDRGHPVVNADVELPRGRTTTVVFHLVEPAGTGAPLILSQPLVHPLTPTVVDPKC